VLVLGLVGKVLLRVRLRYTEVILIMKKLIGIGILLLSVSYYSHTQTIVKGKSTVKGISKLSQTSTGSISIVVEAVTNTQAILSYTAPDSNPCTLSVSESPSYSPLVNDVNTTLFASSNSDARDGSITSGTSRLVVVGTRVTNIAIDANKYTRSLQANTLHYFRTSCTGGVFGATTFTTNNIPAGLTFQESPNPNSNTGAWLTPTILLNDRTQSVTDQFTGALMKPVTIRSDKHNASNDGFNMAFGGFVRVCTAGLQTSPVDGSGYVCNIYNSQSEATTIYFIKPSTGLVKDLGLLGPTVSGGHIQMDVNMCFIANDGSSGPMIKYCYTGDWQEHHDATLDAGTTYSTVSQSDQLVAFDGTFDPTLFLCDAPLRANPGQYEQFACNRNGAPQDSYGWIDIYYGGDGRAYDPMCTPVTIGGTCPGIVAAFNPMANNRCRFCGNHNFQIAIGYPANPTTPVLQINWHGLEINSNVGTAQWKMFLSSNAMSGATSVVVTAQAVNQASGGDTFDPGPPQINDIFTFVGTGETKIVTSVSGSAPGPYTLGLNTALSNSYTTPQDLVLSCNALNQSGHNSGWMLTYWKFGLDPHGTDTTNTTLVLDEYFDSGGHYDFNPGNITAGPTYSGGGRISEGYPTVPGNMIANLDIPLPLNITDSPSFHGLVVPCFSSACVKHPSYHQTTDTPVGIEREWATDLSIYNGGELFFGPPSNPAVLVSGDLYRYPGADDASYTPMYTNANGWRKIFDWVAVTGARPYLDISGPGSSLGTGSGDNGKYCVALIANECVSGSTANQIYFNAITPLDFLFCTSGDAPNPTRKDICISPVGQMSNAIPQLLTSATNDTNATQRSRILGHGMQGLRLNVAFPSSKQLPDASWMLFNAASPRTTPSDPCTASDSFPTEFCNIWMVKVPPFPSIGTDGQDFKPSTISITVPSGMGITNVVVRFGYLEYGTSSQLRCKSRLETCVVNLATINASPDLNPFRYPTEGVGGSENGLAGVACTTSCTVDLPTTRGRVVYYQVVYRSGSGTSNSVVQTDPITLVAVP